MATKRAVLWLFAVFYGLLVWYLVPLWSFDYDALTASVAFYREEESISFFMLLGNNVVLLYVWDFLFGFLTPSASVSLLYGFAASVRVLVLFSIFRFRFCLPLFIATAVFNDLNVCRYSLVLSLTLLSLHRLGPIKTSIISFPFHIFMPATIFMLSMWNNYWKLLVINFMFLMTLILPVLFTRHFSVLDDAFPRIAYVYILFTAILLFGFRKEIAKYGFNFGALMFGLTIFSLSGAPFGNAYYFRFSNLAFECSLLLIAFHYSRLKNLSSIRPFSLKYAAYASACLLASTYSFILIGGNIWRFF